MTMRGNLTTEGLYESTKRLSLLQLTAPQHPRGHQPLSVPRNLHTQATFVPGTSLTPEVFNPNVNEPAHREARSESALAARPTRRRSRGGHGQRPRGVKKFPSSSRPRPPQDQQPPASVLSATLEPNPEDTAPSQRCQYALWIRPEGTETDGGPVITHYDESCPYSLISKTAALNLGLKILPCRPRLQLIIMTEFGMVHPKEYVSLHVEAPWMEDRDLGKRDVAVADYVLESRGIEFLAGRRILQKKVPRPEQNIQSGSRSDQQLRQEDVMSSYSANSAWMLHGGTAGSHSQYGSDLLQPAMETFSRITRSNSISGFQSLSCQSTNDLRPESTVLTSSFGSAPNQSPVDEAVGYNWNTSLFENGHGSLNGEENDMASFAYLNPLISVADAAVTSSSAGFVADNAASQQSCITPRPTPAIESPGVSGFGTDYSSPYMNHMALSLETQVEDQISQTQENFISEDSSAIHQGMTDWSFLPIINVQSPGLDDLPDS